MKLEVGKYYRNADGDKVGPMAGDNFKWVEGFAASTDPEWNNEGNGVGCPDLIAEWTDTPEVNNGPDTLGNLSLNVGDVVEWYGNEYTVKSADEDNHCGDGKVWAKNNNAWIDHSTVVNVVSRATQPPKPFGQLSDAEKGALLLAHHEGKRIEFSHDAYGWSTIEDPSWSSGVIYRIAPTRVEGTCEIDTNGDPIKDTFEATP